MIINRDRTNILTHGQVMDPTVWPCASGAMPVASMASIKGPPASSNSWMLRVWDLCRWNRWGTPKKKDGLKMGWRIFTYFHTQLTQLHWTFLVAKSSGTCCHWFWPQVAFLDEWDFQPEKEDAPPKREETSVKSVIKSNNYSFVAWTKGYQEWDPLGRPIWIRSWKVIIYKSL